MKPPHTTQKVRDQDSKNETISIGAIIGSAIAFIILALCYLVDIQLKT